MRQRWREVAGALVTSECLRVMREKEPPLSRLTASGITERFGLDWGTTAGGPRAQRYLRVALGDAYRDLSLARLQSKSDGNFVREGNEIVYVDATVLNFYSSIGPNVVPHIFGTTRYKPPPEGQRDMTDAEREGWAKWANSIGLAMPEHWHTDA